ncbi:MAG TPA: Fis family transcriptional regulator [Pseudomonas sp.]|nr:Fis family transcriptional regulator [Pseudomonas sp.]
MTITHQKLKEQYHYSPLAGVFEKRVGSKRKGYKWVLVGRVVDESGYQVICVGGKRYFAHRLAWFYIHGEWPDGHIDHRDGDRLNNAIANLRIATPAQNAHNAQTPITNKSGVKGVSFSGGSWTAQVAVSRKPVFMKRFKTKEEAEQAVRLARIEAHGEFANHGVHKYVQEEACNSVIE